MCNFSMRILWVRLPLHVRSWLWGLGFWLLCAAHAWAQGTHTVTDLAGRAVTLPTRIDRILLGEGRLLPVLGMLDPANPAQRLVAMMGDYETLDPAGYAQWQQKFPQLDKVARVGRAGSSSFSDELAIAQRPQLAVFGLSGGHGPSKGDREIVSRLEAAGIAVVFVDFRQDPLKNTPLSIELLGKVLDRRERAQAFVAQWRSALDRVRSGLALVPASARKPSVFLENRVGLADDCCAPWWGWWGCCLTPPVVPTWRAPDPRRTRHAEPRVAAGPATITDCP